MASGAWRPNTNRDALLARAVLLADIRAFFAERGVLEVETPLVSAFGVTDPALEPLQVACPEPDRPERFLQTSPEYAMKRLLAAGAGDIYQLCKAFRAGEVGPRHNPEYTLLEWYRVGWDHYQLLREVAELFAQVLGRSSWQIWPWGRLFEQILGVDGYSADADELAELAFSHLGDVPVDLDRDALLDLLMGLVIEPELVSKGMVFVTDYPASQASLARFMPRGDLTVGGRFECYVDGIELANGYWENTDAQLLAQRFSADGELRELRGLPKRTPDPRLLAAVAAPLPACAGVAVGVDRVLAAQLGVRDIRPLLTFDWSNA